MLRCDSLSPAADVPKSPVCQLHSLLTSLNRPECWLEGKAKGYGFPSLMRLTSCYASLIQQGQRFGIVGYL